MMIAIGGRELPAWLIGLGLVGIVMVIVYVFGRRRNGGE